jgi:hypothetical protein
MPDNRMKKEKSKYRPKNGQPLGEGPGNKDALYEEVKDENSIQDFIELKKLQNRILGKMIENINQTENKKKSKNK